MTITVTLSRSELLDDIRKTSRDEVAALPVEDRYRIEAGSEKTDEIVRHILEVIPTLTRLCRRFLSSDMSASADDNLGLPTSFTYTFSMSERRADGKADALADLMHSYVVNYALAKFYASVSATEFSNAHSALTQAAAEEIIEALNFKMPPIYS